LGPERAGEFDIRRVLFFQKSFDVLNLDFRKRFWTAVTVVARVFRRFLENVVEVNVEVSILVTTLFNFFSSSLTNWPNKLEHSSMASLSSLI
jgi:hypothetical protein